MMDEQWPPARGVPGKARFKKAKDLQWGETPFDDLDRGELLRLVQAYHVAALSARSILLQYRHGQESSPFWGKDGSAGRALAKLEWLMRQCGDGQANEASERIYRKFFRSAYGLLFPSLADDFDQWGIDDTSGEMIAPFKAGETSPLSGRKLRAIKWRDLLPAQGIDARSGKTAQPA